MFTFEKHDHPSPRSPPPGHADTGTTTLITIQTNTQKPEVSKGLNIHPD